VFKTIIMCGVVLIAALVSFPVLAQSQADFVTAFSGKWQVYDKGMAAGATPCQLDLSNLGTDGKLGVTADGCKAPLAAAHSWAIEGSQLVLYDEQAAALVKLGGNQKRITGATGDGLPIILERQGGDGTAGLLLAAVNASHCYYLGYTQKCAAKSEATTLPAEGPQSQVKLLVNLTAHSEPRNDADSVGTVKLGTCVAVQRCVTASDGPWCKVTLGANTGWLRKLTIRQNRWPVVTFANSCG
jgi:hypothetical protein